MECRPRQAVSTRYSSVVRQFTPSRIEHQLLAQVFEFVVDAPCQAQLAATEIVPDRQFNDGRQHTDVKSLRSRARSAA
jgi:hypothetical protein